MIIDKLKAIKVKLEKLGFKSPNPHAAIFADGSGYIEYWDRTEEVKRERIIITWSIKKEMISEIENYLNNDL